MGLADLERKSAQREKQGRKSVWNGNVRLRNRRRDERNGDVKAGAVLVEEDPGELEYCRGLFGSTKRNKRIQDGERGDGMCVVTR
jgi:hypothetical protein